MFQRITALSLFCSSLVLFVGCGSSTTKEDTVTVTGTVTLDGNPLKKGTIRFEGSDDVEKGRASGTGDIVDGKYEIQAVPGDKVVKIDAEVEYGEPDPTGVKETKNLVPPQYNERTKLKAKVTADGDNKFDFQLKSR